MKRLFIIIYLVCMVMIGCRSSELSDTVTESDTEIANEKMLFIASSQVDCENPFPQKCFLVKESADSEYEYFYDAIEGFSYENGYYYTVRVGVTEIENPPVDGAGFRYELIDVIEKIESVENTEIEQVWKLRHMVVGGDAIVPVPDEAMISLNISGENFSGNSGCNTYMGTVGIADLQIQFSSLHMTEIGCEEALMQYEIGYYELLEMVGSYEVSGNQFRLFTADGLLLAEYVSAQ